MPYEAGWRRVSAAELLRVPAAKLLRWEHGVEKSVFSALAAEPDDERDVAVQKCDARKLTASIVRRRHVGKETTAAALRGEIHRRTFEREDRLKAEAVCGLPASLLRWPRLSVTRRA